MAQYGRNFYGSIYYGPTTAFSSVYTSKAFDAGQAFTGPVYAEVAMTMPKASYRRGDKELSPLGSWTGTTTFQTNDMNAKLVSKMSASSFDVVYAATTATQTMKVVVKSVTDAIIHEQTVSTQGVGEKKYSTPSFTFQEVTIEVTPVAFGGSPLTIKGIDAQVTSVTMEIGSGNTPTDMTYQPVSLALESGLFKGNSATVTGKRFIRFRMHLASSDDGVSPRVDSVKLYSGDVTTRARAGVWSASINMENVASAAGVTFKDVVKLDWVQETPAGTSIEYRSRSAATAGSTNYGPETAIYRKGYKRLRLGDSATEGYVLMRKPVDPSALVGRNFNQVLSWVGLQSLTSMPVDVVGQGILLEFYETMPKESDLGITAVAVIDLAREDARQALALFNEKTKGKPFYLGVRLRKRGTAATPVVDLLTVESNMEFRQAVSRTSDDISAVDNGTGIKQLWAMNGNEYAWPQGNTGNAGNVSLVAQGKKSIRIIDESNQQGLELYFKSKESAGLKRNETSLLTDKVWGKVSAIDAVASTTGADARIPTMHYHYNGGRVAYGFVYRRQMGSDFTPSLLNGKRYRYQVVNGREAESMVLSTPMTWTELAEMLSTSVGELQVLNPGKMEYQGKLVSGQVIVKPDTKTNANATVSFDGVATTETSTHNGSTNAYVRVELSAPTLADEGYGYGLTRWKSEEKMYTGYVNLNDMRSPYVRLQPNAELEGIESLHIVGVGETYESIATAKGVDVNDLMRRNQNRELVVGMSIRVPSPFTLPRLAPEAIFQDANGDNIVNPYQIEIIPGSVKKATGERLSDSAVVIGSGSKPGIVYTTRESAPTTMTLTRGPFDHGRDLLGHKNVRRVLSIVDENSVSYTPYTKTELTTSGDYTLDGNYIWWLATQQGAKEPAEGVRYTVTYTYDEVENLEVTLDSNYVEKAGYDVLWRSPEVKVFEGIARPGEDFRLMLPTATEFEGYSERLEDVNYVVEDNDPWVKTHVVEEPTGHVLVGTLDGEDPDKNWYPEIVSGYYYMGRERRYMYAEPLTQVFGREQVPVARNVSIVDGKAYLGKGSENLLADGKLETVIEKKRDIVFTEGIAFTGLDG